MNKEVKEIFKVFCRLTNDNFILDYVSHYGGYVIEEPLEKGGIDHPFGSLRRNKPDMIHFLRGLIAGLTHTKQREAK